MFVSIILDPGSVDSARSLVNILTHSGFRKIQRACWENMSMSENDLVNLKKDIDRVTDYYDNVRIYQFPIEGMFVITELKEKKWKRCQLKGSSSGPSARTAGTSAGRPVSRAGNSARSGNVSRMAGVSRSVQRRPSGGSGSGSRPD